MSLTEKKNMAKGASYALAHRMMTEAIRHNFPLQAITIQESILADRLWSTLNVGKSKGNGHATLGAALKAWVPTDKKQRPDPNARLFDGEMLSLKPELDRWWSDRNDVLHGIAKSFHGEGPKVKAEEFEALAQRVALAGQELVRRISNWSKKQVRRARAASAKKTLEEK